MVRHLHRHRRGHAYEVGDTGIEFTIQSISKPFVLGVALEDQGRAAVLERVGVEPSGNSFNAIVVDDRNRPFNPMVNAGAILATSLVDARDHDDRIDRMVVGVDRRLATVGPGVAVGELAFLEDARRSADVVAERDSRLGRLAVADLQELGAAAPAITATVSANLARNLSERLGWANPHVRMLAG